MQSMIPLTLQIPADLLAQALAAQVPIDRHRAMVERLGEACSKVAAAKAIDCSTSTITRLVEDGRILSACEGTKIDVRSLADYIERKAEVDHNTRMRKRYGSNSLHV